MLPSEWTALPFPSRGSPFYTLKSIAFSNDAAPAATGSKASAGVVLPSVQQNQRASVDTQGNFLDDKGAIARQLRRRDAAMEEYKKVQDHLQETLQKLSCEKEEHANIYKKMREMSSGLVKCNKDLQAKVAHTYAQQQQLRKLRLQVKELKDPSFNITALDASSPSSALAASAPLAASAAQVGGASTATFSDAGGKTAADVLAGAVAAAEAPAVGASPWSAGETAAVGEAASVGGATVAGTANNASATSTASASSRADPCTADAADKEQPHCAAARPSIADVKYSVLELFKTASLKQADLVDSHSSPAPCSNDAEVVLETAPTAASTSKLDL